MMQPTQPTYGALLRFNILFRTNAHWINVIETFSRDCSGELCVVYGLNNVLKNVLNDVTHVLDVTLEYSKSRTFSSSKKQAVSSYTYTCSCLIESHAVLTADQHNIIKDEYMKLLNAWFSNISKINNPIWALHII